MVSDVLAAVLKTEPEWKNLPANLHPKIREILRRCLEKDLKKRYRDIGDVLVEIDETLADPQGAESSGVQTSWRRVVLASLTTLLVGVALGTAFWSLVSVPPSPPVTRFSVPGPDRDAVTGSRKVLALSPDSSHIVYVANDKLYLRSLNQMEATPIRGTEGAQHPFFSPDGQWLGFWAGGDLKKVSLGGGPPQKLCSTGNPTGVTWGADDHIFFTVSGFDSIMRVPATGGELQEVISAGSTESIGYPEILPDGDTLLFVVTTGAGFDNMQIVAQSLNTNERHVLVNGGSDPRYLPTGHLIYFREDTLLAVPFDPASLEVKGNSVPLVENASRVAGWRSAHFSVSPSGGLVYIPFDSIITLNRPLVWVDRSGNASPLTEERRGYMSPRISPDGKRIAIDIVQVAGIAHTWLYDVETRSLSQFTFELTVPFHSPIWSPDGERVTFRDTRGGSAGIFWKPADGSSDAELLLQKDGTVYATSWSPDGVLAFFQNLESGRDIWLLDENGTAEPFLDSPANERAAMFSPDGNWIAYVSDESGRNEVYVRPYPGTGGGRRRISSNGGREPVWRPDGKELFYRVENKMMSVGVETTPSFTHRAPIELFEGEYRAGLNFSWYDIHPDGDRFLMVAPGEIETTSETPQINVVLNWSEEVKARVPWNEN